MRRKYILVVPLWGETHFKQWLKYSLPSYLAENNIPYLVKNADFSLLICTDKHTETLFKTLPIYRKIREIFTLAFFDASAFIPQDAHYYGYGLTYLYHAAIRKYHNVGEDIYFIFLNSDFILTDGIFKTVHDLAKAGSEIVFCPSLRAIRETLLPKLDEVVRGAEGEVGTLSLSAREGVQLVLERLHPTVVAQTINREGDALPKGLSSNALNQFYWRVGEDLLLGHHFLIFPLMIKPKVVPPAPTGYIDYNVVYDFHPRGEITYITDSDDGLIIEVEGSQKESENLWFFYSNASSYYRKLSQWVTPLHYNNFKNLLVFHVKNLENEPLFLEEKGKFDEFVGRIDEKFKKFQRFRPFREHPYWGRSSRPWRSALRCRARSFAKKFLNTMIEVLSGCDLRKTYFLVEKLEDGGSIDNQSSLLDVNQADIITDFYAKDSDLYIDIGKMCECKLYNDVNFSAYKKVYLFSFDAYKEKIFERFLAYNKKNISSVSDVYQKEIFLASIRAIQDAQGKSMRIKFKAVVKMLLMRGYLKFKCPYPHFVIFEVDFKTKKHPALPVSSEAPPILFSVPVWGESYVDVFLSHSLRSQLAPKNIPGLQGLRQCEYVIYTTLSDAEMIRKSAAFSYLETLLPVRFFYIPSAWFQGNKYQLKRRIYKDSLCAASGDNKVNGFLNGDMFFSDGFISESQKLLKCFRTIEVVGPRILFDKFSEYLEGAEHEKSDLSVKKLEDRIGESVELCHKWISIEPRLLSRLAAQFLHEICNLHFFEGDLGPFQPSHVYWKAGDNGIVAHCFHLYPVFLKGQGDISQFEGTIDDDLVLQSSIRFNERFFTTDPTLMFCCELSREINPDLYGSVKSRMEEVYGFYNARYFAKRRLDHFFIPHFFGDLDVTLFEKELALKKANIFNRMVERNIRDDFSVRENHESGIRSFTF